MKHFRFLIIAAVAVVFGACQTEPADNGPTLQTGDKEVRIVATIENSRVATEIDMRKSYFQNGDRIALDIMRRPIYQTGAPALPTYERRDDTDFYLHNALMEYEDGEWVFVNSDNKIILEEGYRYDYYAYYPGTSSATRDPEFMEYSVSSSTESDVFIPHSDLLWASHATMDADDYNNTTIELNFKHVLSMLEVRQVGLGKSAVVKLRSDQNIILNGTLNVGTGEFTAVPPSGTITNIPDVDREGEYQIIYSKPSKEATFMAMDNGRYVLYLPPQSLKANFKTYIETQADPSTPENLYKYELEPNDGIYWTAGGGESSYRSYDFKLFEPDAQGKMQHEHLMYDPNCILLNVSDMQVTAPVGKAYAMWLYDTNVNGIPSVDYEANKALYDELLEKLYGELSLKLLWTDKPDFTERVSVHIDNPTGGTAARILARINGEASYEGNAVYGLYIGDELRWSWHIWANSVQNPAATQGVNGDIRFLRSNLGAWSTSSNGGVRGLLYQWGRKDPFPGANALGWDFTEYQPIYDENGEQINDPASLPYGINTGALNTIKATVQNPATFSTTWNPTGIANLWNVPNTGNEADRKSPYDPCPLGWRLPRTEDMSSAWYLEDAGTDIADYTDNYWLNNIIQIKKNILYSVGNYPQTNYRMASTGAFSTTEISSEIWHGGHTGNSLYIADKAAPNINVALQDDALGKGKAVRCMRDMNDTAL